MAAKFKLSMTPHRAYEQHIKKAASFCSSRKTNVLFLIDANHIIFSPSPEKCCCDHIVSPEKQLNFWRGITLYQKNIIGCGEVVVIGNGSPKAMIETGAISTSGGAFAGIRGRRSIKLAVEEAYCCARFPSQKRTCP